MGNGFEFLDIILLVMIAAFIFLRLRSVLGRRMGHEQSPREDISRKEFKKPEAKSIDDSGDNIVPMNNDIDFNRDDILFQADTPLAATLRNIHAIDASFDPSAFPSQAEMAYEAIVQAYANGDRSTLKDLLSEDVYNNFVSAIESREKANEVMHTDILSVKSSEIVGAVLNGKDAEVTVRFETEMISMTKDEDGVVVQGDPHPHTVREEWTFARRLKSRNPNWLLITTKSAE
ncbi:Tim44/TimA family putative adaptor protein [Sneathiella limimaris]|uniref:Tim44/TimA family putative adaptor protein n=1 Tax=Sneathiella limimaris TaxID=1964213 RepID=UPI00146AA180|nr:Tim44/TimA family putative adaptor protein [Sneathiella limimaris]